VHGRQRWKPHPMTQINGGKLGVDGSNKGPREALQLRNHANWPVGREETHLCYYAPPNWRWPRRPQMCRRRGQAAAHHSHRRSRHLCRRSLRLGHQLLLLTSFCPEGQGLACSDPGRRGKAGNNRDFYWT
jgi:hypothetical protein